MERRKRKRGHGWSRKKCKQVKKITRKQKSVQKEIKQPQNKTSQNNLKKRVIKFCQKFKTIKKVTCRKNYPNQLIQKLNENQKTTAVQNIQNTQQKINEIIKSYFAKQKHRINEDEGKTLTLKNQNQIFKFTEDIDDNGIKFGKELIKYCNGSQIGAYFFVLVKAVYKLSNVLIDQIQQNIEFKNKNEAGEKTNNDTCTICEQRFKNDKNMQLCLDSDEIIIDIRQVHTNPSQKIKNSTKKSEKQDKLIQEKTNYNILRNSQLISTTQYSFQIPDLFQKRVLKFGLIIKENYYDAYSDLANFKFKHTSQGQCLRKLQYQKAQKINLVSNLSFTKVKRRIRVFVEQWDLQTMIKAVSLLQSRWHLKETVYFNRQKLKTILNQKSNREVKYKIIGAKWKDEDSEEQNIVFT